MLQWEGKKNPLKLGLEIDSILEIEFQATGSKENKQRNWLKFQQQRLWLVSRSCWERQQKKEISQLLCYELCESPSPCTLHWKPAGRKRKKEPWQQDQESHCFLTVFPRSLPEGRKRTDVLFLLSYPTHKIMQRWWFSFGGIFCYS